MSARARLQSDPMKVFAIVVGLCALVAFGASAWLAHRTMAFVNGPDDAPEHEMAGNGNGYAVYAPAWLLAGLGAFLARFAWRLWKD